MKPFVLVAVLALLPASRAAAQARPLVREGDLLPGVSEPVKGFNALEVNRVGGYAVMIRHSLHDAVIWGAPQGGPGAVLVANTVANVGTLGFGDQGEVFHPHPGGLAQNGSVAVSIPGAVPGVPGMQFFNAVSDSIGALGDGTPVFACGYRDAAFLQYTGLFRGLGQAPILRSGDPLPPSAAVVGSWGFSIQGASFARDGEHWVALVGEEPYPSKTHVVLDGSDLLWGGAPVRGFEPVPTAVGGLPGERWRDFVTVRTNDAGSILVAGDTDAAPVQDAFIAIDGTIVLREGTVIGGRTLVGFVNDAWLAEDGSYAWIWDVDVDDAKHEVVGYGQHILLAAGDLVDWDGDGFVDAGHQIVSFNFSQVRLSANRELLFSAKVKLPGGFIREALFQIEIDELFPSTHAVTTSGGQIDFAIDAGPANAGRFHLLLGSLSGAVPGFSLAGQHVPLNVDAYFLDTVAGANGPGFVNTFGTLDAQGRASSTLLTPSSPSLLGLTAHHALIVFTTGPLALHAASGAKSLVVLP